ncbi:P-loop ATPase, Sll1717 family [Aeromonas hydrophila]|uniref:P-loop ATPase, Sll1717 family n=1 Tax=Aeromonas hydrophila TaxID=644 RepID=UPI0038D0A0FC
MAKVRCRLKDPFPLDILPTIDLGNMDGHRDTLIEHVFIVTKSMRVFKQDRHSIIVGSFGSGKSAVFNLLKNNSDIFNEYQNDLVVSIDEQIQFDQLKADTEILFPGLSEKLSFQLLWKFQICRRICEELSLCPNFGNVSDDEKYIAEFLSRTGGLGGHLSIISRLKELFERVSFKVKAKLASIPVDVEVAKDSSKIIHRVEINLDQVIEKIINTINSRGYRKATVIIDKLDKFVAGEEYKTQKIYIESLLQVEDDLYDHENIGFKIFIRSDLYDRLDFSALGPDKAGDNTLRLHWSTHEIQSFVAKRLFFSFMKAGVWTLNDIIQSSDFSEYSLRWYEKTLLNENKSGSKYMVAHFFAKLFGRKRNHQPLFDKLNLTVINKLFESKIIHECPLGKGKEINIKDFLDTHFLDGNGSCTPRYMLIFLKELLGEASNYYFNSPDIYVTPVLSGKDWVYNIFTPSLTYKAYIQAKELYINHVSKVDDKWRAAILELLSKKGVRTTFEYKWIKSNITLKPDENDVGVNFLVYLKVIGFLKETKYDVDIKKRNFELPILYKKALGTPNSTLS